jgi:hypothetical protein
MAALETSLEGAAVAIRKIDKCVSERVSSTKMLRRISKGMADAFDELMELLEYGESRLVNFAPFGDRKARLEVQRQELRADCETVLTRILDHMAGFEVKNSSVDTNSISECCDAIVKVLAYCPALNEASKEQIQKSIEERNALREDWVQKLANLQKNSRRIERLEQAKESRLADFDIQLATLSRRLSAAKELVGPVGQFKISGNPGTNKKAKEIRRLWDEGDLESLKKMPPAFSSGSFTFEFDPNPTLRQNQCALRYTEELDMIQALKQQKRSATAAFDDEICECKALGLSLITEVAESKKQWDAHKEAQPDSWTEFKMASPEDFAKVLMCFKLQEILHATSIHMDNHDVGYGSLRADVRSLKRMLQDDESFDIPAVLDLASRTKELLTDPDQSPMGFLANLPEAELSRALQPMVTGWGGCQQVLDQFGALATMRAKAIVAPTAEDVDNPQLVD